MLFYSFSFLFIFFPAVFVCAYCIRSNRTLYLGWLSFFSLVFYVVWRFNDIYLFAISILLNYVLGKSIYKEKSRFYLFLGVSFNLALLFWFKYAYFINNMSISLFDYGFVLPKLALPLAISFYTFEQISYLVDSYKGLMIKHSFLEYLFLITFFPRLIAGPIIQPKYMLSQLKNSIVLTYEYVAMGGSIFVIGLFKKVVIADYFSSFVDKSFSLYNSSSYYPGFVESWSSSLAYTFQIYFDFSGYSDMAIGLALILGIKLPPNFNSPYKSTSIIDFWRRWHISLSSFLRDYLYIPLGGNQKGEVRKYANLLIVMLLGGIWHGANLTFLFWGFIHGVYLIINNMWIHFQKKNNLLFTSYSYQLCSWIFTFCCVTIAWVYFRSDSIVVANKVIMGMFYMNGFPSHPIDFSYDFYLISLITLGLCCFFPNTLNLFKYPFLTKENELSAQFTANGIIYWKPNLIYAFFITVLFIYSLLLLFPADSQPPFIYFNF